METKLINCKIIEDIPKALNIQLFSGNYQQFNEDSHYYRNFMQAGYIIKSGGSI